MKKLALALLVVFHVPCFAETELSFKGSDVLGAKMLPHLAAVYSELHPNIQFEIESKGTGSGLQHLLDNTCDIALVSRTLLKEEQEEFNRLGLFPKQEMIAHNMIAIIVNSENKVKALTTGQLEQVFSGEIKTWGELGGDGKIVAIDRRNSSSGTYQTFRSLVMNQKSYGKNVQKPFGAESLPTLVSKDANAIGYCGVWYSTGVGISAVAIDGVLPTIKNVRSYPLVQDLSFYTLGPVKPELQEFIRWVRESEVARATITKVGFVMFQPESN